MEAAAAAGRAALAEGDPVDAVEAAVNDLERNPAFNAGVGSKLQHDGVPRPEAAVMRSDLAAGSATGLVDVVEPVSVARDVMERTNATQIAAPFSVRLAEHWGHEFGDLRVDRAKAAWQAAFTDAPDDTAALLAWLRERDEPPDDWDEKPPDRDDESAHDTGLDPDVADGDGGPAGETVGAVAVDADGRLCAGTSTGGRTRQLRGRVGDTPQIGAGTYCNADIAVSATGRGESILATVLARRVAEGHARNEAYVRAALDRFDSAVPGVAGVVSVTDAGRVAVDHTSDDMAWTIVRGPPTESDGDGARSGDRTENENP